MAFKLHFAAVRRKAFLFLGFEELNLISKPVIRNSEFMPAFIINHKVFSSHQKSFSSSKNVVITETAVAPFLPDNEGKLETCWSVDSNMSTKVPCKWQTFLLSRTLTFKWKYVTVLLSHLSLLKYSSLRSTDYCTRGNHRHVLYLFTILNSTGKCWIKHWGKWMRDDC